MNREHKKRTATKTKKLSKKEELKPSLGFLSKVLLGKFDDTKVIEILMAVMALTGSYKSSSPNEDERRKVAVEAEERAKNFIWERVLYSVQNMDVSFLQELIDCIRLQRGDGSGGDQGFLDRCSLLSKVKANALTAYQVVYLKEARAPMLSEIEMYLAHQQSWTTKDAPPLSQILNYLLRKDGMAIPSRNAINSYIQSIQSENLPLTEGQSGRPTKGQSMKEKLEEFLIRYELPYKKSLTRKVRS